jgi:type I restriction enzyme R subunit
MTFNENTRVKLPAILHLYRLGYDYISLSNAKRDESTNIFTDIFKESLLRINPEIDENEIKRTLENIYLVLENEDLGKEFYNMLTATSGVKLIDFKDFNNNSFNVVTELTYKNGEDEFRPDITLLINGMPLAFIEVKKPNNQEGILAERDRINVRFKNKKFRRFINITQILVFSNNMEYDDESIEPIQGAFYSSSSYREANFNCFREEDTDLILDLRSEEEDMENLILKYNNLSSIKHSPEFSTNKNSNSPTNRILSSLFSKSRLATLLKYSIAYLDTMSGPEKHIMRYPQFFATKAIERKLESGIRKGIIWHTQGSGKTALAFYNVHYLTDYFQKKGIVPKFYFIVDRIDLMIQANKEFTSRGLVVHNVNTKDDLLKDFRQQKAIHNLSGNREITVVNIQKFKDDPSILKTNDYDISIQRIYFLDEVHRSYNPKGSFLANLISSDRNAILIGLTGTPLIGNDRQSRDIFGDYIHKYYYNASIADGYTLKLIREDIETTYKFNLKQAIKDIEILKGDASKREVYSHPKFVGPMLDYIIMDYLKSIIKFADETIGGMVVCDSSDQAKEMYRIFDTRYLGNQILNEASTDYGNVAEIPEEYEDYRRSKGKDLSASLILYDVGTKDTQKDDIENFKEGKINFLFVYNMLLTGFDAKRLKKLYIGRVIRNHNLLQTLTRVNRPYKKFKYGYVVDFADITKEFDATNKAYFDELQLELGDEMEHYSSLFKTSEEIEIELKEIEEKLFHYDLKNAEVFSQQISEIEDRKTVLEVKKALENAKNLYNVIRMYDHTELLDKVDFKKLNQLYNETSRHLDMLNLKYALENKTDITNLLNEALENVIFVFRKLSEEELVIADQLKDILRKTREALGSNFDKKDPEFVSLYEELERLFKKKNLDEITQDEMKENIDSLDTLFDNATELNRKNNLLKAKYENDAKYARIHKRILEKGDFTRESKINSILMEIKNQADEKILNNNTILNNESYFEQYMIGTLINSFEKNNINIELDSAKYINSSLVKEYLNEYKGIYT